MLIEMVSPNFTEISPILADIYIIRSTTGSRKIIYIQYMDFRGRHALT